MADLDKLYIIWLMQWKLAITYLTYYLYYQLHFKSLLKTRSIVASHARTIHVVENIHPLFIYAGISNVIIVIKIRQHFSHKHE